MKTPRRSTVIVGLPWDRVQMRFIGEVSADGRTIKGRWERGLGDAGDRWEIDFPMRYVRR